MKYTIENGLAYIFWCFMVGFTLASLAILSIGCKPEKPKVTEKRTVENIYGIKIVLPSCMKYNEGEIIFNDMPPVARPASLSECAKDILKYQSKEYPEAKIIDVEFTAYSNSNFKKQFTYDEFFKRLGICSMEDGVVFDCEKGWGK